MVQVATSLLYKNYDQTQLKYLHHNQKSQFKKVYFRNEKKVYKYTPREVFSTGQLWKILFYLW